MEIAELPREQGERLNTCLQTIYRECNLAWRVCSSMAASMLSAALSARRPSSSVTNGLLRRRTAPTNDLSSARRGSSACTFYLFYVTPGIGRFDGDSAKAIRLWSENFSCCVTRI